MVSVDMDSNKACNVRCLKNNCLCRPALHVFEDIYIYVLASGFLTIHKQPVEYSLPDVPMYFCKLLSPGLCLQWYAEDKNEPEILVFAKTLLPWQECYL